MAEPRMYKVTWWRYDPSGLHEPVEERLMAYDVKDAAEQVRIKDDLPYPSERGFRCSVQRVDPISLTCLNPAAPEARQLTGCPVCGARLATIRGKIPGEPDRMICPTCAQERLEDLLHALKDQAQKG